MELLIITDHQNPLFMDAFKLYFKELGINVRNYEALFEEMNSDIGTVTFAYVENNQLLAFLMCKADILTNWFFEMKFVFIREFWVNDGYRNQGIGSSLLKEVEAHFKSEGIEYLMLTTDTAPSFYMKHGFIQASSIVAKNQDDVYIKRL